MKNNNNAVIFLFFSTFIASSIALWNPRNKRLLLLPELSVHYKLPGPNPFKTVEQRAVKSPPKSQVTVSRVEEQRKREIRTSKSLVDLDDARPIKPPARAKAIRHPCYFSPIQCLLTIPEDQLRTIVKTHNGVQNIEGRHSGLQQRNIGRVINRLKQHDDRHNLFGNGLFRLSPFENY